jgi:hypothetical protein
MKCQPVIVFFVGGVVVQDDVNLLRERYIGNDIIEKGLEVWTLLDCGDLGVDRSCGHIQRSKQVDGAVSLVGAFDAAHDFAAAGLDVASLSLQRLNRWLLVNAEHQCVVRRPQVQADHVCGFGREFWIGAHTPRAHAPQLNAFLAKDAPDRVIRHIKRLGQRSTVPAGKPLRRGKLKLLVYSLSQVAGYVGGWLATACPVAKRLDTACKKSLAPCRHRIGLQLHARGNLIVSLTR